MSTWKQKTIWQLIKDDKTLTTGWCKVGDYWYYLDNAGIMYQSQWFNDNGKWYYLDENGHMLNSKWFKDTDSKWYYLGADGAMYVNGTFTIDGKEYIFNDKGAWKDDSSLVSEDGIDFVKDYEKFYANKYDDGTGTLTQGYGCIGDEIADWGDTITEQQASDRLNELINANYAKPIKEDLDSKGISLTTNQFDALVSCAYNIGVSSLLGSSLYSYITSGGTDADEIMKDFRKWNKVIQNNVAVVWSGLDKRRIAEANIYNNGIYDSTH